MDLTVKAPDPAYLGHQGLVPHHQALFASSGVD